MKPESLSGTESLPTAPGVYCPIPLPAYCIYLILMVCALLINIYVFVIILWKRYIFHFSFTIILLQVLSSGVIKLLFRILVTVKPKDIFPLSFEILFDFGMLIFICLMSVNRLLLVLFPTHRRIYDNRLHPFLLSSLTWLAAITCCISFHIGKCERWFEADGKFQDTCSHTTKSVQFVWSNEYCASPLKYHTGDSIRDIVFLCYDVLPVVAFSVYLLTTIVVMWRRRQIVTYSTKSGDYKLIVQGLVILIVYGTASIINLILNTYTMQLRYMDSLLTQLLFYFYSLLDVITVALIPLSICITVRSLRRAPIDFLKEYRARGMRAARAREAFAKWRGRATGPAAVISHRNTIPYTTEVRKIEVRSK